MVLIHKRLLDFSNRKSIGKKNPTSKQELAQEEQLGNFTRKWHRQSITIRKVVQLERYLDHPSLNLQDIYAGSNAALCNIVTVCPPGGSTISEMVVA